MLLRWSAAIMLSKCLVIGTTALVSLGDVGETKSRSRPVRKPRDADWCFD